MNTNNSGIFDLITELCEKFEKDPCRIKQRRSKCYELLLGKRTLKVKKSEQIPLFLEVQEDLNHCNAYLKRKELKTALFSSRIQRFEFKRPNL